MELIAIAAVAENGVIARDGEIPWDYPADKRFYEETIEGHPAIMGRTTFENSAKPASTSIVLTSHPERIEGGIGVSGVEEALEAARATGAETVYVIGGQGVYEALLDRLDYLIVTHIPGSYEGDRFFPEWTDNDWTLVDEQWLTDDLRVTTYAP